MGELHANKSLELHSLFNYGIMIIFNAVQVLNMNPQTFRGFFVQPRDPDGTRIGTFTTNDNTQQILDCQGQGQGQEHPLGVS